MCHSVLKFCKQLRFSFLSLHILKDGENLLQIIVKALSKFLDLRYIVISIYICWFLTIHLIFCCMECFQFPLRDDIIIKFGVFSLTLINFLSFSFKLSELLFSHRVNIWTNVVHLREATNLVESNTFCQLHKRIKGFSFTNRKFIPKRIYDRKIVRTCHLRQEKCYNQLNFLIRHVFDVFQNMSHFLKG